jgi:hypothetical protein
MDGRMKSFYDTVGLPDDELAERSNKAKRQEDLIRIMFDTKNAMTASEVWEGWSNFPRPPITSIRRAMTNLAEEGFLIKTSNTRIGLYGMANHVYCLKNSQLDLF